MRGQLDSGEEIPQMPDDEALSQVNEPFLLSTFKDSWSCDITNLKPEGHTANPQAQNYEILSRDVDAKKYGEYTLNPETQNLDFEQLKAFVSDLKAFNGKKVHEVIQHIVDTYGATHHIPGIEYWKWLIENPSKNPRAHLLKIPAHTTSPAQYSAARAAAGSFRIPAGTGRSGTTARTG